MDAVFESPAFEQLELEVLAKQQERVVLVQQLAELEQPNALVLEQVVLIVVEWYHRHELAMVLPFYHYLTDGLSLAA